MPGLEKELSQTRDLVEKLNELEDEEAKNDDKKRPSKASESHEWFATWLFNHLLYRIWLCQSLENAAKLRCLVSRGSTTQQVHASYSESINVFTDRVKESVVSGTFAMIPRMKSGSFSRLAGLLSRTCHLIRLNILSSN